MRTHRLTFENSQGHKLSGRLEMPVDGKPKAYALFAHCFTCSKNLLAVGHISRALTAQNIAVLRFDFTGLGESEGDFANTNFSSNVEDLIEAAAYLEKHYEAPQILIGHSLGGAAVLMAARKLVYPKVVATIGAPSEPEHVKKQFGVQIEEIEEKGIADVKLAGRKFTIKKQFLDDLEENRLARDIPQIKGALLVMHSPQDTTVGIDNATKIYLAAKHPRSFISLDGADHLLTRQADAVYVGNMIVAYAERYLEVAEDEDQLDTDLQTAVRLSGAGYTSEVIAAGHRFLADEPKSVGGNNLGPSPYDLLTASLGACTAMTLRMYANHKEWDLKEVTVHLQHEKRHAQDSDATEKPNSKLDHIDRKLEIEGDLTEEQRQRLLEIADRCPVHRTLESQVRISTTLVENEEGA
ncbi:MAG: bifunctional alpha/beta hydrolase/OsmC family protein [Bacteroidota bacterium]